MGERYGWVPGPEQQRDIANNTSIFKEYPWIQEELEKNNTSITEIEIQDGVLRSQKKANAYFYFRSVKMEVPGTAVYKEEPDSFKAKKLQNLKQTLRGQKNYPVTDYDSPEHLGCLVERDFKELVDALFPKGTFSPLKKERLEQAAFLKSKTVIYEPVLGVEAKLNEFAEAPGQCLVIAGESGSGKSAIIANWIKKRTALNSEKLLYHFAGQSGAEGDYRKICARLISETRNLFSIYEDQTTAIPIQQQSIDEKQKSELQNLLVAVQSRGRLIIILDGVDKFTDTHAKLFNWLPEFPANVKIIFSTTESDPSMEYFNGMHYSVVTVPPLEFETRKKLIANYLSFFGKKLTEAQVEKIAGDKESENPLALCTLLEELRIFGEYGEKGEKLDAQIDRYLEPDTITGMFVLVLERLEKAFSRDFAETVLSMLFVSRSGLSEAEILLLPGVVPLYWAQFSNSMANYLNVHGGKVTFAQNYIRDAVKKTLSYQ